MKIVNKYNLLGTALWALDNEGADFWTYYKDSLNEKEYESEKDIELRKKYDLLMAIAIEKNFESINIVPIECKQVFQNVKFDISDETNVVVVPMFGMVCILKNNDNLILALEKSKKRC